MNTHIPHSVLQFGSPRRSAGRRYGAAIRSNRFTLTGALLFGWLLPLGLSGLSELWFGLSHAPKEIYLAGAISFLSVLATHVLLSKIGVIPLVDDKVVILPSAASVFLVVLAAMSFVYGRAAYVEVLLSFVLTVAWYLGVAMLRARFTLPRLAYLGGLPDDMHLLARRIEWVPILRPVLPHDLGGIVFDGSGALSPAYERLLNRAALRHIPIYETAHFREMLSGRVTLDINPAEVFGQLLPSQPYLRVKRLLDTIAAAVVLILIAPVMLLVALAIRLDSPGAAVFRQPRVGYRGKVFVCYKFRTMRTDLVGPAYTREHDPRITRLGMALRKWRIDELPQIFNILKGEMSWIGPRPEAVQLSRRYRRAVPFYAYRHLVRPGITGWAAVHQGNVALEDAAREKLEFDFYYIRNFSVWLDFLIVLMTIRTIVTGFGAR